MGYKSRGNWNIPLDEDRFKKIFGERKVVKDTVKVPKDKACWGDYEHNRKIEKVLSDYRRFTDRSDRKKINSEYYGRQKEFRKKMLRRS